MVQGGLLTAHLEGVHGYGWSPGEGPPSDRVPEQLLQAAPILKRRRRYKGEFAENRSTLGVSTPRAKYRQRGAPRGATGQPGGCSARPRVGPRQGPFWSPCGGPPSLLW